MDLRALRLFIAVAEEGSIHSAARRIMLSQPAASQALRKLEREIGGDLVVRSPTGIRLTAAGTALLEHGYDIVNRLEAASSAVREIAVSRNYVIRLGLMSGPAAAGDLTLPIVSAFRQRYPNVTLNIRDLSFADQFDAVVRGEVDVAIVRPPCDDDRLETMPLFCEPTVLCFSARHRLAGAEQVHLAEILDEPMVELVRTPERWRDFWELNELRGGPPQRIHPEPAVTLSELRSTLMWLPVIAAAAASGWQHGLRSPLLRAAGIVDAPNNDVAVAFRRAPERAWAREFAECAREVTEGLCDITPGRRLIRR